MVLAREGSRVGGSESFSGVQRSDSDRRCGDLRGRAEELAVAELCARAVQREAGEGRACVSPDVCGDNAIADVSFRDELGASTAWLEVVSFQRGKRRQPRP